MDLTREEKEIIKLTLTNELEALECSRASMGNHAVDTSKSEISIIIDKLDGGSSSIWMITEEKIKELLKRHNEDVLLTAMKLCNSGALDLGSYDHSTWALAKVLFTASARQHCDSYAPMSVDGDPICRADLKNLKHF